MDNVALVRRYIEDGFNRNDHRLVEQLVDPGVLLHSLRGPEMAGRDSLLRTLDHEYAAFPDLRLDIARVADDGEVVWTWLKTSGHQAAPFAGQAGSGRPFATNEIHLFRLEAGTIREIWFLEDGLGLFQQLGLTPPGIASFATPRQVELARESVARVWADPSTATQYHSPGFELWDSGERTAAGLESMTGFIATFGRAFDEVSMTVDEAIAGDGHRVTLEWTLRGRQRDTFFGVPSQGRRIAWIGMMVLRFEGDLIVHRADVHDFAGVLRQLKGEAEPPR